MSGSRGGGYSITISATDRATKTIDQINRRIAQITAPVKRLEASAQRLADSAGLKAVGLQLKGIEQSAAKLGSAFSRIIPLAGSLAGALTAGGALAALRGFADVGTNLLLTSQKAQMSIPHISRLSNAATMAGGNFGAASESLVDFNEQLQLLRHSPGQVGQGFLAALAPLSLTTEDLSGQSTGQAVDMLLKKLAATPSVVEKNKLAGMLGLQGFIPLVDQGTKAVDRYIAAASRMPTVTKQQAQDAQRLNASMVRLRTDIETTAFAIIDDFAPGATKGSNAMAKWVEQNQAFIQADIGGAIHRMVGDTAALVRNIGGDKAALHDFLELLASFVMPPWLRALMRLDVILRAAGQYAKGQGWTNRDWRTGKPISPALGSVNVPPWAIRGTNEAWALTTLPGLAGRPFAPYDIPLSGYAGASGSGASGSGASGSGASGSGASGSGASVAGPTSAASRAYEAQVAKYFLSRGYGKTGTAGILAGGPGGEDASFNPLQWGDHGTSFGLWQFHGAELERFRAYVAAQTRGRITNLHQLSAPQALALEERFVDFEMTAGKYQNVGALMRGRTGAAYKAAGFTELFENPFDAPAKEAARAATAGTYLEEVQRMIAAPPAPAGGAPAPLLGQSGPSDVTHTVKGQANIKISLAGAPPGTHISAVTDGDLFVGPPALDAPMPPGGGP